MVLRRRSLAKGSSSSFPAAILALWFYRQEQVSCWPHFISKKEANFLKNVYRELYDPKVMSKKQNPE